MILERMAPARVGEGQVLLLEGEGGIGKSRLARALSDLAAAEGAQVLAWQCASHLANRPLHPVIRELESAAGLGRARPADERRSGLAALTAAAPRLGSEDALLIADLLGIGTPGALELDAATRARRTNDALARRVEGIAEQGPLLLLLEDAHWADAATIDLPVGLLSSALGSHCGVAAGHRTGRLRAALDFGEARSPASCSRGSMRKPATRLLRSVATKRALPQRWSGSILEKAGGVPLFVEELTKTCWTRQ